MRITFIETLLTLAEQDERVFLITPDMGYSVLEPFAERFPDRFLNVGIAEQNAVGVAAGLALSGMVVYVYSIVPFVTMRCFEQVRVDVAYMKTNVRLVGVGGGFSYGPAGATHHAIEDIAIMRALPHMTVVCPGDPHEVRELVSRSVDHQGPMYIRLGRNGEPTLHNPDTPIPIGSAITMREGEDLALLATSNMLETASKYANQLVAEGKEVTLLSIPTVKPLDIAPIQRLIEKNIPLITLEEHNVIGGLGSAVAEVIAESGKGIPFLRVGVPDTYSHVVGSQRFLRDHFLPELPLEKLLSMCKEREHRA